MDLKKSQRELLEMKSGIFSVKHSMDIAKQHLDTAKERICKLEEGASGRGRILKKVYETWGIK